MIERYEDKKIKETWSDENKVGLWQRTDLALMAARVKLGRLAVDIFARIRNKLLRTPVDIAWWKARDKEITHDLEAFLDERRRFLIPEDAAELHKDETSFDTEEPATCEMLIQSFKVCEELMPKLLGGIKTLAIKYRHTPMLALTHGQPAELQSAGKRCLTWYANIDDAWKIVEMLAFLLRRSKMSGMIGNYGGVDPELERAALEYMGLEPFYGATQIMPRAPLAMFARALCQLVQEIDKIALDIRLGALGGTNRAIYQEPFGKSQKASSRNPAKKNTIKTEQLKGMARMAIGYDHMLQQNIETWLERAIEQSCVERIAWPDLFHVVCHSIKTLTSVLEGLVVYPDHMLQDIVDNRGCYAGGQAKEFLRERMAKLGLPVEYAYRAVQLASFNAFEADEDAKYLRENIPSSLDNADVWLHDYSDKSAPDPTSIMVLLETGALMPSRELDISEEDVKQMNGALARIFADSGTRQEFKKLFKPSYLLRNEDFLFKQIIGE